MNEKRIFDLSLFSTGGILKNYFRCVPNGTIKTIVQSKYAVGTGGNCHYFTYKESYYGVNSNMTRVDGHWSDPALLNKIYINHYKTKSLEDFNNKLQRWGKSLTGNVYRANLRPNLIYDMDASMTMNCSIPQLKEVKQY